MSAPIEEDADEKYSRGKDRMPALSRQKQPSIATCFGLDVEGDTTLPRYLGTEVVQITCGKPDIWHGDTKDCARPLKLPQPTSVHKALLCRYSRYFHKLLGNHFEKEIISEAMGEVLFYKQKYFPVYKLYPTSPEHTYAVISDPSESGLDDCYIPSSVLTLEQWNHDSNREEELGDVQHQEQQNSLLIDESPTIFASLLHWLYTQELVVVAPGGRSEEQVYAHLYGMAERLDFPTLRQQCFIKLVEDYYYNTEKLPDTKVAKVIIDECSLSSTLRKYLIAMLAYVMIDPLSKEPKKAAKLILDLDKEFAATVAEEVMKRLGSEKGSEYPCDLDEYEVDDSDSDVSSSIDVGSDIVYDSDGYMSLSESVDNESLSVDGEEVDGEQLPENVVDEPAEEEDVTGPTNLYPGVPASLRDTSSPSDFGAIAQPGDSNRAIKSEAASPLGPSVANKRKRGPSEVTGPSKRIHSPDDVEFMDLTNSP